MVERLCLGGRTEGELGCLRETFCEILIPHHASRYLSSALSSEIKDFFAPAYLILPQ